jgi:plasmid stabilization system protein ParE
MILRWSPLALKRVEEIALYIKKDNPQAARDWIASVFSRVALLPKFPDSGRIVPEVNRDDVRELLLGAYRIIYRRRNEEVAVLTVRHGKQLLPVEEIR